MPPRKADIGRSRARVAGFGAWWAVAVGVGSVGVSACAVDASAPLGLPAVFRTVGVAPPVGRVHVVQPGDTVWDIAGGRSGCMRAILAASAIRDARRIRPGAELTVPAGACPRDPAHVVASSGAADPGPPAPLPEPDGLTDDLDSAEAHLRAARFEEALAEAREAIRSVRASERDADVLRAHLVAATVHLALADAPAARESLARGLDIDAAWALDPASTSPKVIEALAAERARREIRVARSAARSR